MKDLRDSVHADDLCNVLFLMKAVHCNHKLFVTVHLAITTPALTAGSKAAKVIDIDVELEEAQVVVDKGLAVLKVGLEDVFRRHISSGLSQWQSRFFRVKFLKQEPALNKVPV